MTQRMLWILWFVVACEFAWFASVDDDTRSRVEQVDRRLIDVENRVNRCECAD